MELCNHFIILPKSSGKVCICLNPARLKWALIRLEHKGPTINDILPKLTIMCSMPLIVVISGYHSLKLKIILLNHICMSVWQVQIIQTIIHSGTSGRYVPAENWWDIYRHTKHIRYCWWHLIDAGAKDHDKILRWVKICWQENLKLNKIYHLKCTRIPFLDK